MNLLRVRAIVRRQAYVQRRAPQRWFDVGIWPMVDTVIWGSIGAYVSQQGGAARSGLPYMLSGILLMHVLYQANVSMSTGFMDETWSRNLLNLMVSPLRESELLAGLAVMSLARLALGLSFVALAAWGLYAFDVTSAGWGLIPVVAVLMASGWAMSMVVIALVLRFGNGAEILCWGILFVVVALSGAFYPLSALPGGLQPVAGVLPSTHAFEAARQLLDGRPMPWGQIRSALLGLAVLGPLALAYLARMLHLFRQRGYVTRYS
jgi:ABC-2 type transport system permease protein